MAKKKQTKSRNDVLQLPPVIPELQVQLFDTGSDLERTRNLVLLGYSTIVYAQENRLPRKDRVTLSVAFSSECVCVLNYVSSISRACDSLNPQDRSNLCRDFESLCSTLENMVRDYLLSDRTIPSGKFPAKLAELHNYLLTLLIRAGGLSKIYESELRQAVLSFAARVAARPGESVQRDSNIGSEPASTEGVTGGQSGDERGVSPENIPSPLDTEGWWRCKSLTKLREIDLNPKREGIKGTKKHLKDLKAYLKKHSRVDIAESLYWEDGQIKTRILYGRMFLQT